MTSVLPTPSFQLFSEVWLLILSCQPNVCIWKNVGNSRALALPHDLLHSQPPKSRQYQFHSPKFKFLESASSTLYPVSNLSRNSIRDTWEMSKTQLATPSPPHHHPWMYTLILCQGSPTSILTSLLVPVLAFLSALGIAVSRVLVDIGRSCDFSAQDLLIVFCCTKKSLDIYTAWNLLDSCNLWSYILYTLYASHNDFLLWPFEWLLPSIPICTRHPPSELCFTMSWEAFRLRNFGFLVK